MNADQLEKLLTLDEGPLLDFKEKIDLVSDEGKGNFLKDILALVNSATKQSFLIIGVEDKTKKPIGIPNDITEERIQDIVSYYCRPPIDLIFSVIDYHGIPIGVVQLFHRYNYHTLKVPYTYSEKIGKYIKQIEIRDRTVFIRRGSRNEEATPDEIVDMGFGDTPDLGTVLASLDRITAPLDEIAYNSQQLHEAPHPEPPNRYIETTFIAMLTGLFLAWQWEYSPELILFAGIFSFFAMVTTSALHITHYGLLRAFSTGITLGGLISLMFLWGQNVIFGDQLLFANQALRFCCGLLMGAVSGVLIQKMMNGIERAMS